MDTQNSEVVIAEVESQPKDRWQAPTLTRIEIKQTMAGGGYGPDGFVQTSVA